MDVPGRAQRTGMNAKTTAFPPVLPLSAPKSRIHGNA